MGLDDQLQIAHCAEISHKARNDSLLTGEFLIWTLNVAIEEPAGIQLCAFTKQTFSCQFVVAPSLLERIIYAVKSLGNSTDKYLLL